MKIIIIRHAEPDYPNNTLTEKGFKEADLLGKYYKDLKADKIFCSPLNRSKLTADGLIRYRSDSLNYVVKDFLREFDAPVDTGYAKNHLCWDLLPSYMDENKSVLFGDKWYEQEGFSSAITRYKEFESGMNEIMRGSGYEKKGIYFDAINPNHDVYVFVCHHGAGSMLTSYFTGISPIVIADYAVFRPSAVTTLYTEEREKGKAIFRITEFGSVKHLEAFGEKPSFMGRFKECFSDKD